MTAIVVVITTCLTWCIVALVRLRTRRRLIANRLGVIKASLERARAKQREHGWPADGSPDIPKRAEGRPANAGPSPAPSSAPRSRRRMERQRGGEGR